MTMSKRAERAGGGYHAEIRRWRKQSPLEWKIVSLENISSSGILFSSHEKIELDAGIELNITLPSDDDIHCWGKVCRIEGGTPLPQGSIGAPLYKIAAFFTEIEDSMKAALERFAEKHRVLVKRAERARGRFTASVRYNQDTFDWDLVTLRDVSSSGLLFNCNEVEAPQGGIEIILNILSEDVYCPSEVVRVVENPLQGRNRGEHIYGVAVRFKSLDNEFKRKIDLFVKDFNGS